MGPPLVDGTLIAVSRMFDDAGATREPSHSEIEFQIKRAGLSAADPAKMGPPVGKAKRVRGTLNWAIENDPAGGSLLVQYLVALLRGCGGFRDTSPNFIGLESRQNAIDAFRAEGFELTLDGELRPVLLDSLSGAKLTQALSAYVRRAKHGASDAALVTGTGKDLLEATAAHAIVEKFGSYPQSSNFPTLLGQAFIALDLATPQTPIVPGEPPQRKIERAMFEMACAVNGLRNKQGTGHGRPWLPSVSDAEAKTAIEIMGTIAEAILMRLAMK